ncbi:MAG: hypothetical protein GXC78_15365 [Chitinophagaceae bacterium]|nr:hypothetical protein [Chitinophagaceae bacterium]
MKASLLFSLCWFSTIVFAQTSSLQAHYFVEVEKFISQDGELRKVATLPYEGILQIKNARSISYLRPLYLSEYPEGRIELNKNGLLRSVHVSLDTMQSVYSINLDSLLFRACFGSGIAGASGVHSLFTFERGCRAWQIFPETKEINGILCQRAVEMSASSDKAAQIWFAPDISAQVGPMGIMDAPGLVYEAYFPSIATRWKLREFIAGSDISDAVFWPRIFNSPSRFINHLRKYKGETGIVQVRTTQ